MLSQELKKQDNYYTLKETLLIKCKFHNKLAKKFK